MRLDTSKPYDANKATTRLKVLIGRGAKIDLTELRESRTIKQNKYFHVLVNLCAIEWGYNAGEMKTTLKRECEFMTYEKNNSKFLKRTRDFDSKQLTEFIEWIINYAGVNGLHLPSSEEYLKHRFEIDKEIDLNKNYL